MNKEADISLYNTAADTYEELQHKRPDYTKAISVFKDLFKEFFGDWEGELNVADFCCGTGENTLLVSHEKALHKATLIDINEDFLEIAKKADIHATEIQTIKSDILKVQLKHEYDLVISMFAYHHVQDKDKSLYLQKAKSALRKGGILILGEIYMPDRETTLKYYKDLLKSVPKASRTPQLEQFLTETAQSSNFEYKVPMDFAVSQLTEEGFAPIKSIKVWPEDKSLPEGAGMYVEVWGMLEA